MIQGKVCCCQSWPPVDEVRHSRAVRCCRAHAALTRCTATTAFQQADALVPLGVAASAAASVLMLLLPPTDGSTSHHVHIQPCCPAGLKLLPQQPLYRAKQVQCTLSRSFQFGSATTAMQHHHAAFSCACQQKATSNTERPNHSIVCFILNRNAGPALAQLPFNHPQTARQSTRSPCSATSGRIDCWNGDKSNIYVTLQKANHSRVQVG